MVLALKELSIRGDFRTTVEYLISLLETEDFINNEFDTAWLDALIAGRMKADKPPVHLGVVCTSVLIADQTIINAFQEFQNCLERLVLNLLVALINFMLISVDKFCQRTTCVILSL